MHRLNTLTLVLKSCNGDSCRHPWQQLHPGGKVKSLSAALDSRFDKFYAAQPKVAFADCALGYLWEKEGPHDFNIFGGGKSSVSPPADERVRRGKDDEGKKKSGRGEKTDDDDDDKESAAVVAARGGGAVWMAIAGAFGLVVAFVV